MLKRGAQDRRQLSLSLFVVCHLVPLPLSSSLACWLHSVLCAFGYFVLLLHRPT